MSSRDRFFQSLSDARNQLTTQLENTSLNFGGTTSSSSTSSRPSSTSQHQQSSSNGSASSSLRRNDTTATLPLYSRASSGPNVPQQVLHSRPGEAQSQADRLATQRRQRKPTNGLGTGNVDGNTPLKRIHEYPNSNGKISLDLFTPPQRTPTYMGATLERGRGALTGRVSIETGPQEKISNIRLKLKCVARVAIPFQDSRRSNPQSSGPISLSNKNPSREALNEREVLLLQLEQHLYSTSPSNTESIFELGHGFHELPFRFELPAETLKGNPLPPSYVLEASKDAREGSGNGSGSVSGGGLGYRASLIRAAKGHLPESMASKEWASVKWYVKLTVERPGMFKVNDRIFAPFSYLPPPTRQMSNLLMSRLDLTSSLRSQPSLPSRTIGSHPNWKVSTIALNNGPSQNQILNGSNSHGSSGLLSSLFGKSKDKGKGSDSTPDRWTLSIPDPPIFPLRSIIPILLKLDNPTQFNTNTSIIPLIELFEHVQLISKNNETGYHLQSIARATLEPTFRTINNGKSLEWQGYLDVPGNCGPCFEIEPALLKLEYFIGVRLINGGPILHAETFVLACAPPNVVPRSTLNPQTPAPTSAVTQDPQLQLNSSTTEAGKGGKSNKGKNRLSSSSQIVNDNAIAGPSNPTQPQTIDPSSYPPEKEAANSISESSNLAAVPSGSSAPPLPNRNPQPQPSMVTPSSPPPSNHQRLTSSEEDDIGIGMELPPSYFEATGLHDAE